MKKISSFTIKKLRMEGFKRFSEPAEFDFGGLTYISGHNSQGKSSIADAITYAIAGVPYFGAEKNLDRLYSIGTKDIKVILDIEADGAEHALVRERVNDVTTITYDGAVISQADLAELFGERDVFLSIFNPLYFIEELGDKGRNLLARYLPAVAHADVMARLSEPNRKLIETSGMASPEGMLSRLREQIKSAKDDIIYLEGQRDLLADQVMNHAERLKSMQTQAEETEKKLNGLWKKRIDGLDFKAMEARRSELQRQYDALLYTTAGVTDIDAEIMRITNALELRRSDEYKSPYAQALTEAQARLDSKIAEYRKAEAEYKALQPGVQCPACKREITEVSIGAVRNAYAENGKVILAEGQELTAQLKELQELDKKAHDMFDDFKTTDIAELEKQLKQAESRKADSAAADSPKDKAASIKAEIQSLDRTIANGNLDAAEAADYNALLEKYKRQCAEIALAETQSQEPPEGKEQKIKDLRAALEENKALETAVKFYIAERMAIQFAGFDMLNKVSIQLYEVVKTTGEVKDVFKFTYEDRPYKYLSYSEKIKAGLELSELLKKLTDSNYPVFVDNGESVPVIDNIVPSGQVIISQVVKNAPLKVSCADAPARPAAA